MLWRVGFTHLKKKKSVVPQEVERPVVGSQGVKLN